MGHPPSGYGIWFYRDFAPPAVLLRLPFCLWTWGISFGGFQDSPEKAMAPQYSTLPWKIRRTEEPGRLQSIGLLPVGHDWATSLSVFTFTHWRRKWQPTPVFLPGESQGQGSLVGCRLWGRRVGHYWSDLAAVAAASSCWRFFNR